MKLPHFIIGGVMKSGTTFLHNLLSKHPDIHIIERNMNHAYFDDDRIFKRGVEWYNSLYDNLGDLSNTKVIGQTSADCAFNPGSVERILDFNKGIKLIFVLRHPIDRAYSLYWHQYSMARETRTFEDAIRREPSRIKRSYHQFKHYSYIERSRYASQFSRIQSLVPDENLLLIDFSLLITQTERSLNHILEFLGIPEEKEFESSNYLNLPKNAASIPKWKIIVRIASCLRLIGLNSLGKRLVNRFKKEGRPPKMSEATRHRLEAEMANDIAFYNKVKGQFEEKIR